MALYRDQGIVLRTYKLGETDRILNLLTQGRGKVRAVAKGVRRPGSRFGGRLEPYSHVDLQLYEGRNLDIVRQAELIESFAAVRADYVLSACAATMVEATERVIQEDERDLPVFLLLRAGLQSLAARPPHPAVYVDAFLLRLAGASGFHVFTEACAVCRAAGDHAYLSVPAGGVLCRSCAPVGTKAVGAEAIGMVRLLASNDWSSLPGAAERLSRLPVVAEFVRTFVEHHLDRQLKALRLVPR
jgi:DNA repair protein RecO (recombination protein O)